MKLTLPPFKIRNLFLAVMLLKAVSGAYAADQELLDILLQNGAITQAQHNELLKSESLTSEDILQSPVTVERLPGNFRCNNLFSYFSQPLNSNRRLQNIFTGK